MPRTPDAAILSHHKDEGIVTHRNEVVTVAEIELGEPWGHVRSAAQLGAFLRQARERAGLSQKALADELGIDRKYLYQIESGRPTRYTQRLFALTRILGVRVTLDQP